MKSPLFFLLLSSFFFCSFNSPAQSQIKTFPAEDEAFIEELHSFFEQSDKKTGREFIDEFAVVYNGGKFTPDKKQYIKDICNFMLKKRLKPFPDFKNFLSSMMNFVNKPQPSGSFEAWQKSVEKTQSAKTITTFQSYMQMSENLFSRNAVFTSATTEWISSSSEYKFEYDSVPKVVFGNNQTLICRSKGDSAVILKTRGVYYPTSGTWIGEGGRVEWTRANINPEISWAELKKYRIQMKSSAYTADSVTYYNKAYFTQPLLGQLSDKVLADMTGDKASYPEFNSYSKRFQIPNIYPEVDYEGGFQVRGSKVLGTGDEANPATLRFKRNKSIFLVAASNSFTIRTDRIASEKAAVVIYWENDSIYHPGLALKFIFKDKELSLIRDNSGIARSPYFDSYHQIDMYIEALYWKLDEPQIDLRMIQGSTENNANFESTSFFKDARFNRLQGLDEQHPLSLLKGFSERHKSRIINIDEFARESRITHESCRPLLLGLAQKGFLLYKGGSDQVVVLERTFDYIKYKNGKKDYDVISFNSTQGRNQSNAQLNLLNFDLKVFGVNQIFLSDSQAVNIIPKNETVTIKKNRDFNFAGVVNAGRFQFFGKEFSFEYDKFKINLTNVDSLRIRVSTGEKDENGQFKMSFVKSVIEHINGDLLIDYFNNKSGVVNHPQYPIFNSRKDSYVYYDTKCMFKNVYKRDKVYFHLDPFTIDSLDNFTNDALAFKGDFESGGIFPNFDETLRLQPDRSLGFKTMTPADGYPAYGGKGRYLSEISMSNKGLRGDGNLEYVTSTTTSKDFQFFPDSMNTWSEKFDNKPRGGQKQFPMAVADSAYIHWMPLADYMVSRNKEFHPFDMYGGIAKHKGSTTLRSDGMTGSGVISFYKADLKSRNLMFSERFFDADTCDFEIQSGAASDIGIATVNFKSHVDFDTKVAEFKSNGGGSYVKFPSNQYMCYMDQFKWFMEKDNLELSADKRSTVTDSQGEEMDLSGAEFISMHPDQDSLRFLSPRARYDIKTSIIHCHEVRLISVADARIFPDSGNVTILRKAIIETLKRATVVANIITKYHKLYNATIDIYGKKSYSGNADYTYTDELGEEQILHFTKLSTDASSQTVAEGEIPESSNFKLSPYFDYKGNISLIASNPNLGFKGSFRMNHDCAIPKNWIEFSGDVNPKEVFIPLGDSVFDASTRKKLVTGLLAATDTAQVYSTFQTSRRNTGDWEIILTSGFIYYDKDAREYRVSNREKIRDLNFPGNFVSLNTSSCKVYCEGKIDISNNLGQLKLNAFGNGVHNTVNDSMNFELIMALDFFIDDGAMKLMRDMFEASSSQLPVPFSRPVYERAVAEKIGKKEADRLISQVNLYGAYKKVPDELEHTMFLSDLKMKWNPTTRSFVSEGPIGLGIMGKSQLNKYFKGKLEVVKKRSGDLFNLYLEDDGGHWYFFNYQSGNMMVISSEDKFNNAIKEVKPDKRRLEKKEKNEASYQYTLGTPNKKSAFLRKFETTE
jgi:hypothetical protein